MPTPEQTPSLDALDAMKLRADTLKDARAEDDNASEWRDEQRQAEANAYCSRLDRHQGVR